MRVSSWHYKAYGDIPPSRDAAPGGELLHAVCDESTMLITGAPLNFCGPIVPQGPGETCDEHIGYARPQAVLASAGGDVPFLWTRIVLDSALVSVCEPECYWTYAEGRPATGTGELFIGWRDEDGVHSTAITELAGDSLPADRHIKPRDRLSSRRHARDGDPLPPAIGHVLYIFDNRVFKGGSRPGLKQFHIKSALWAPQRA